MRTVLTVQAKGNTRKVDTHAHSPPMEYKCFRVVLPPDWPINRREDGSFFYPVNDDDPEQPDLLQLCYKFPVSWSCHEQRDQVHKAEMPCAEQYAKEFPALTPTPKATRKLARQPPRPPTTTAAIAFTTALSTTTSAREPAILLPLRRQKRRTPRGGRSLRASYEERKGALRTTRLDSLSTMFARPPAPGNNDGSAGRGGSSSDERRSIGSIASSGYVRLGMLQTKWGRL